MNKKDYTVIKSQGNLPFLSAHTFITETTLAVADDTLLGDSILARDEIKFHTMIICTYFK